MAWNDSKSPGDVAHSADWNDMVSHQQNIPLGNPTDGSFGDGLLDLTSGTKTVDAVDDINEILSELAPADALTMEAGTLTIKTGTTKYTGRISSGTGQTLKAGQSYGDSTSDIVNDATFVLYSPSQGNTFNKADEGSLVFFINDIEVGTFDLGSFFDEDYRAGSQIYTPKTSAEGYITVTSVRAYNDFSKWQKGNCDLNINAGSCIQGYNAFKLRHSGLSTVQTTGSFEIFYDNDGGANPSCNTPTITEATKQQKILSGVYFYTTNATFDLDVIGSNLFNNVYHSTGSPLSYSGFTGVPNDAIAYTDPSGTGVSNPPAIGEHLTITNKLLTITSSSARSTNARVTITPRDPYGNYSTAQSASENRLVDTYGNTSTVLYEYFDDENYRIPGSAWDNIPSVISGLWLSSDVLTTGSAQVYNGTLIYPSVNFTSGYLPSQTGANYSAFSGDQEYYRAFYDTDPHSSGQLEFANIVGGDIAASGTGSVNVFIKLPTQTGWLDLGKDYVQATFTGADGDGCRTAQSGDDWSWTAGAFSTSNSGYKAIIRVIIKKSKTITQIRELGW